MIFTRDHIINLAAITGDQIKLINKKDVWKSVYEVNLYAPFLISSELKKICLSQNHHQY